jgi:ribosomal protein S18 acetylase RimI-like enzyme
MSALRIRRFDPTNPAETDRLYEICLKTGDNGQDATGIYRDPHLIGTLYVGQYARSAPEFCFVLVDENDEVVGYAVGTPDSVAFDRTLEEHWWPQARATYPREKYPLSDMRDGYRDPQLVESLHTWSGTRPEVCEDFPAHFHIDLLPTAQGGGNGKRLLLRLLDEFRTTGVPGVHLGVSGKNERAVGFYGRIGFEEVISEPWGYILGMRF